MPSEKELNKQMIDRLMELMAIRADYEKSHPGHSLLELERAIKKAKAPMTEEQIALVEKLLSEW